MSPTRTKPPTTLGSRVTLACLWEATAPKPGNVYRGADFGDLTYADFLISAAVVGPVFDRAGELSTGQLIRDAVAATQAAVATNTNLGTLLLLAPLAKAASIRAGGRGELRDSISAVLNRSTIEDADLAYQAIRLARPGGMGKVTEADVADSPRVTLLEAMRLAEQRDLIAQQYTNGFADVFQAASTIVSQHEAGRSLADAIVLGQLKLMGQLPDTLIQRKCGPAVARESADRAARAWELIVESGEDFRAACAELDFWLRADGHRRNPGATADVIAAALFVLLEEDRLNWPMDFYQPRHGSSSESPAPSS